ncbi:MAG: M48 family metallopeptidase [Desulfitobacteriaceae bacterium]
MRHLNYRWLGLIILAGAFSLIYLGNAIFPGRITPDSLQYFSIEQAQRARAYNFVPRLLFIASFALQAVVLVWLVFSNQGTAIARWLGQSSGRNYWWSILLYFFLLWFFLRLLSLPFTLYGNYFWQQTWGFSTQSLVSWWQDYFKNTALDLLFSTSGVLLFFLLLNRWPKVWWVIGAMLLAFWLVLQNFLWPVIVAPMFNNFQSVKDPAVINLVKGLADKAGIQVQEVLVMDASRRTTMANAYFTGLGKTKQIVIYDNLLKNYPLDEVGAVLAHEIGHWQKGHIIQGLTLGIIGNFLVWGLLALFLREFKLTNEVYGSQTWASLQLFILLILFVTNPLQSYISREMEQQADQVSLELTRNPMAEMRLQIDLATKNLSDVSPPDFIVWFGYTHPPALSRIKAIGE